MRLYRGRSARRLRARPERRLFELHGGLDIPLAGVPEQLLTDAEEVGSVALIADDYVGASPAVLVGEGDRVALGQPLFEDRKRPGVVFGSPGTGTVGAVHRDDRGELESIVVRLAGADEEGEGSERVLRAYASDEIPTLDADRVREQLLASGDWTALRERPFGTIPAADAPAPAIFVTAIDTHPVALSPQIVIDRSRDAFRDGLHVLSRLTDQAVYVCAGVGVDLPATDDARIVTARFAGPHPAGLPGTHIHFLAPVDAQRSVWHLGYQDVIAIGELFTSGSRSTARVVSLAGPVVRRPRLVTTRLGASLQDLLGGELDDVDCRVISGSVLSGRRSTAKRRHLRRYHVQVSVLPEHRDGLVPEVQANRVDDAAFSYYSHASRRGHRYALTTSLNGRVGPMLPLDVFERVVPLDLLVVPLLRALLVGDVDTAEELGCLELVEEDLALCTFLCPGKNEYGPLLRAALEELDGRKR